MLEDLSCCWECEGGWYEGEPEIEDPVGEDAEDGAGEGGACCDEGERHQGFDDASAGQWERSAGEDVADCVGENDRCDPGCGVEWFQ